MPTPNPSTHNDRPNPTGVDRVVRFECRCGTEVHVEVDVLGKNADESYRWTALRAAECDHCHTPFSIDFLNADERVDEAVQNEDEVNPDATAERAFEESLNADNAPSEANYRASMIDAGRGHLLS